MRFLFWNIKKNALGPVLSDLSQEHDIDVVILAECVDRTQALQDLNRGPIRLFHLVNTGGRITLLTRLPPEMVRPLDSGCHEYLALARLQLAGGADILLAAVHLPSKMWSTSIDQRAWARVIAEEIRVAEDNAGHSRTVLVGDLNMSPFEEGVISADGFHGVMTVERASRNAREIGGKEYRFFYNPMWGMFGDNSKGPAGTYHRPGSNFVEYFWHMFDQVLIRPALLAAFDRRSVRILDRSRHATFLRSSGVPNASGVSDHLPLLFSLNV